MKKVVIVSAIRTPIGKDGGQFESYLLEDLGGPVIEGIINDIKLLKN